LANAMSVGALTLAGVLAVIADAIGKSTAGRFVLVLSAIAGVVFLAFAILTASIYLRNQPKRLIPPSLRNR
jgi:hypothetical protein